MVIFILCLQQLRVGFVVHVINDATHHGNVRRAHANATWAAVPNAILRLEAATILHNPDALKHQEVPGRLSLKQISLVRSHSKLYAELLRSNESHMLIAEDDLSLCPTFSETYASVLSQLPRDFDWVKLEQCNGPLHHCPRTIEVRPGHNACTALYIVSKAGAAWLLKVNPPNRPGWASDGAMDDVHWKAKGVRPPRKYSVSPLGWQDKSYKKKYD